MGSELKGNRLVLGMRLVEGRSVMRGCCGLALLGFLLILGGNAHAQEGQDVSLASPVMDDGAADLQLSWAEKRQIRTLQRRLFAKFDRVEFSGSLGIVPNDPFVFYLPVSLRVAYHFNEAFAIEGAGSFLGCFTNNVGDGQERGFSQGCLRIASDLKNELAEEKKDRTGIRSIEIRDQQVGRFDLLAMWSPFFGKVAVLNDGLVHFDVNVVGGAGVLVTESLNRQDLRKVDYMLGIEGVLGAGFKFYFGGRYAIRADFRQYIYQKQDGRGTATPSEISLGFSVFTN